MISLTDAYPNLKFKWTTEIVFRFKKFSRTGSLFLTFVGARNFCFQMSQVFWSNKAGGHLSSFLGEFGLIGNQGPVNPADDLFARLSSAFPELCFSASGRARTFQASFNAFGRYT